MFIYIITFLFLLFGIFHFEYRKKKLGNKTYYILLFIIMTCTTGLRFRVGGDALMYEDYYYPIIPDLSDINNFMQNYNYFNLQVLFVIFCSVCKTLFNDYYFYQFIHSFFVNSVFFWFIWKYSKHRYSIITLLYVTLIYFYLTYEVQREVLAICCFLLGYKFYLKNNWIIYYLFCIIGFTFHISAIILFILPLLKLVKFNKKLILFVIIISFPLILFKDSFSGFLQGLLFTEAMEKKAETYSEIQFSILGTLAFYFVRVVLLVPYFMFYIKNKRNIGNYDWLFSAYLIISVVSQVIVGTERFLNYLYIPFIILFFNFFDKSLFFYKKTKKTLVISCLFLNLFFVLDYKVLLDYRYIYVYFPYGSIFEKQSSPEREYYIIEVLH